MQSGGRLEGDSMETEHKATVTIIFQDVRKRDTIHRMDGQFKELVTMDVGETAH